MMWQVSASRMQRERKIKAGMGSDRYSAIKRRRCSVYA